MSQKKTLSQPLQQTTTDLSMGRYSSDSDGDRSTRRRRRSRSRSSSSTSSRSRRHRSRKSRRHRRHSSSRSKSRSRSASYSHSNRSRTKSRDRDRHRRHHSYSRSSSRSRDKASRKYKKSKHKRRRRSSSSESGRSERFSKSRSVRSSQDREYSSRGSTKEKDRRILEKEKSSSPVSAEPKVQTQKDLSESDRLAFNRAVEDIEGSSFIQESFKSSRGDKTAAPDVTSKNGETFNFGTQAELTSKGGKFIPLSDDSLFSPHLFGDHEEREEKYLRRIFSLRQKALQGEPM